MKGWWWQWHGWCLKGLFDRYILFCNFLLWLFNWRERNVKLSLVDVKELLVALDSGQLAEEAEQLAHHCGGVPVVLRTTAAVLAKGSSTKTLRSTFQTSPVSMLKSFNLSKLSSKLQPFYCLGICFSRLKPDRQAALVSSAVFPRVLSEGDAQLPLSHWLNYELKMFLQGLVDTSMLQYNCKAQEDHLHKTIQSLRVDRANQEEL